ncbi:MAG: tetratricopeptide repeat protein [Thermodesulfovibrionales bacterium]|nr:tetratricopeptide repeat protein [Thermodesulfovibrionales bacterium]
MPALCLILLSFFQVSGCGGAKEAAPVPDAVLQSVGFNRKAEDSFKKGDYERALIYYQEALRVNRSIENTDGIAVELINISAVCRRLKDNENALRSIDEILNNPSLQFSDPHRANAAFIKAMIHMDGERPEDASSWADKALSFCGASRCGLEGKIFNLKGRIALSSGDASSAITFAAKGLDLSKGNGHAEEAANSLRLLAGAKALSGQHGEAFRLYEDAFSLDKSLGLSRKIALDLMGAGRALLKQGRPDDAAAYFRRALSVARASGDEHRVKDAEAALRGD